MIKKHITPLLFVAGGALVAWLLGRYALPVGLPFLSGTAVALGAEPMVGLMHRKLKFPRWLASTVGVLLTMVLLLTVAVLAIALLVRQAGTMTRVLPDVTQTVQNSLSSLEGWLVELVEKTPSGVQPVLRTSVENLFSGSGAAMDKMTDTALNAASNILSRVLDSALGLSTGVLAAFMISIRLPKLKKTLENWLPQPIREKYLPAILELRHSVGGWLLAQLKLSGVTALILLAGFWALQIPLFPVWALLVAFVDALPVLGTGAVLLPWSLICFLQGQNMRGLGLLGVYALVWLIRSVLEPRLVGNELGLDPLVTLLSMYAGYKLFGLIGMILSPVVAVCTIRLAGIFRQ